MINKDVAMLINMYSPFSCIIPSTLQPSASYFTVAKRNPKPVRCQAEVKAKREQHRMTKDVERSIEATVPRWFSNVLIDG